MTGYSAEQADDGTGMDADVIPWTEREFDVDVTLSEFPYFHYHGPDESADVARWMAQYGARNVWTLPTRLRESSTYRTDLVGVRIDYRQFDRRKRTVGHLETLVDDASWKSEQPNLRSFLNFRRDGPMTREYYVNEHGLHREANGMNQTDSLRTFQWLVGRGFLTDESGGDGHEAVDIEPLLGAVHAIELKREPREWDTALEQAKRADVYADFCHVCFSERTADRAVANADAFRDAGVGLFTVSSSDGTVTVHVDADHHKRPEGDELLSRPRCERWNLNERVLERVREQ